MGTRELLRLVPGAMARRPPPIGPDVGTELPSGSPLLLRTTSPDCPTPVTWSF